MSLLHNKGILFILSSPSGVGKTTTASLLIQEDKSIVRSISCTTRKPRIHEVHSKDYFFLTENAFKNLCNRGEILEYATVFGNYYGTPKKHIIDLLERGKDVICCIDWQGARQITTNTEAVTIFLLPPSFKELKARLNNRSTDTDEVMERRLEEAKNEILHYSEYDYIIINHIIDHTVKELKSIILSERAKVKNKTNIEDFIGQLISEEI